MAKDGSIVRLDLPSAPPSIKRARDAVAELAEQAGAPAGDVKLAVSEAVTNAVVHAFRDRAPGTISVQAEVDNDGQLVVVVADDGSGMRPNPDSAGLGLGISLITSLSGEAHFDSSPAGLTVSMVFEAAA
jgi:serine/threonine-protein kinase RsbW/stage II sporulation protein AB (anti-sigma F factor)